MTKKTKAELALEEYLAGLTEQRMRQSDAEIFAYVQRSSNAKWRASRQQVGSLTKTDKWRESYEKGMEKRSQNSAWLEKLREGIERRKLNEQWAHNKAEGKKRPVVTPWGVFRSGKEAGEAYNAMTNTKNGKNRVSLHINRGTPGYRFISIEEYQKLTLNSPKTE